jgi:hypothetical protein
MGWQQYAAGWADQHGGYDLRRAPALVRQWLWLGYAIAGALARLAVPPTAVFVVGVALAPAVPVLAARGGSGPLAAAGLVLVSSFLRTVDAALAVLSSGASPMAAIRGTVAARVGEIAGLAGCWALGVPGLLLVACGALAGLHELVRREALAAGMSTIGVHTVGEHPMRISVLVIGLGLAGLAGEQLAPGVLAVAMVVWLLLALIGAGQLMAVVRRALP